jgi:hypothetical protein
MMKKISIFILITLIFTGQAPVAKEPVAGYAAFFYLETSADDSEVYDDFSYYLNSINPWLKDNKIVVSYYSKAPFKLKLSSGQELEFDVNDMELDLGFVLVKPNGQFKVYYGVHTDVDIQQLVKDFFAEKAL